MLIFKDTELTLDMLFKLYDEFKLIVKPTETSKYFMLVPEED